MISQTEAPVTVVRIYLTEADSHDHGTLMKDILRILHDQHRVRGATVFRGIAGFGHTGELHEADDILRMMVDLPLVIEFFDTPEVVNAALDVLKDLVPDDRIICWQASCR